MSATLPTSATPEDPKDATHEMSDFARSVYETKYAWKDADGNVVEDWNGTSVRVVTLVMGALGYHPEAPEVQKLIGFVQQRKFMPGGRYLYATGRDMNQTQNCFSGQTRILTDKGAAALEEVVGQSIRVRNRFGTWEDATVECFGEQELFEVEFANGATSLATENHRWWQSDGTRVTTAELESVPFSVADETPDLDAEGVRHGVIFGDGHLVKDRYSQIVFVNPDKDESLVDWFVQEKKTVTVGCGAQVSYDTIRPTKRGTVVSLQPKHYKTLPTTYSPEYARGFIGGLIATDGCVPKTGSVQIHCEGLDRAESVAEIAVAAGCVVNSVRVVSRVSPYTGEPRELSCVSLRPFSAPILLPSHKERIDSRNLRHNFRMSVEVDAVKETGRFEPVYCAVVPGSESFTLANGLITSNCLLLRAEDSREGWAELLYKSTMALMTGAGIGIDYSDVRESGAEISRTGGFSSGPVPLMRIINELGRNVMQGGSRRSAIWAGLNWLHPDIFQFITEKDYDEETKAKKAADFNHAAALDMTNVSILLDDLFFEAYRDASHEHHEHAVKVYRTGVAYMVTGAEPGFSVDIGENAGETLRNACTEIVSSDDSDVCNLGSINFSRVGSKQELAEVVRLGTLFLLAGTVYSQLPYEQVHATRSKNRRLGLGAMGLHEWLLQRGFRYGPNEELGEWFDIYATSTEIAHKYADQHGLSRPVKTRAIAPTGTIGIVAETTTGIEPIFCVAFKRILREARADGQDRHTTQYVIDPTAQRLIDSGVAPELIEDAYSLAKDPTRRIEFQAWAQKWVDHGISSTNNMEAPITDEAGQIAFGDMLMRYLPKLRGITCYPDGARGGQPLTAVTYAEAVGQTGVVLETEEETCVGGICGL